MIYSKNILWYHPDLKEIAREFRNNPTPSEKILWNHLRNKKMKGYDFHRQKPIRYYIVDFYCPKLYLAIEIDGNIHDKQKEKDVRRQNELEDIGIKFLRFTNEQIIQDLSSVLKFISDWIDKR